jgi:hypothetical protein
MNLHKKVAFLYASGNLSYFLGIFEEEMACILKHYSFRPKISVIFASLETILTKHI